MGKSTPAAPDYTGAANAQAAASKENLMTQNYANRPSIETPFGSQTWQTNLQIDPTTSQAVTAWTQKNNVAPELQSALDAQISSQNQRSQLANSFMNRVRDEYKPSFNYEGLPAMTTGGTPGETQLSNQGFKLGSEGYKRGLDELAQRQAAERYNAYDTAGNEAQRMYGSQMGARQQGISEAMSQGNFNNQALGQAQGLDINAMNAMNAAQGQQFGLNQSYANQQNTLRQQALAEQAQRRGMSLNEMNALMSGQQVQMPTMPQFNTAGISQTPNLMGAMQNTYQANLDAANAKNAGISNAFGGLTSLASGALSGGFSFSDIRLKSNIRRVGTHSVGVGVYEYDIFGHRERGVIAQELQRVRPDLVRQHDSGYLTVNYGAL